MSSAKNKFPENLHIAASFETWSLGLCGIATVIGCIVIVEWCLRIPLLARLLPDTSAMDAVAACTFILGAAALLQEKYHRVSAMARIGGRICALAVLMTGAVMLSQNLFDSNTAGYDALAATGAHAMPPAVALNFCLLGAALLMHEFKWRDMALDQILALPVMLISMVALHHDAYHAVDIHRTGGLNGFFTFAIFPALAFLCLSVALLLAHPQSEPVTRLTSSGPGGGMLRRLLPAGSAILVAGAWIRLTGQASGLFDSELGTSVFTVLVATLATALLWRRAAALDSAEAIRACTEEEIRRLNTQLEERVAERTAELETVNRELREEMKRCAIATEALRNNEESYRFMFESNPLPLMAFDHERYRYTAVNQAALRQYGYTREEFLNLGIQDMLVADEIDRLSVYLESTPVGYHKAGLWHSIRKGGTIIPIEIYHHVIEIEGRTTSLVLSLDVGERLKAEQALQDYTARLRMLSQQLLNVQEAERCRIARELHDQIGQTLTAVKLGLQSMRKPLENTTMTQRLEDCIQLSGQALDQVRMLSLDLRPPMLDELGLAAALDSHIKSLAYRTGLDLRFTLGSMPAQPSWDTAIACFRVAQEALTNIVRHANVSSASVALHQSDRMLRLEVADDGSGFDHDVNRRQALEGKSVGLLSMAERVTLAGGEFEIVSSPGKGTRVRASFPLISGANAPNYLETSRDAHIVGG